jgi:hypothetical protein
MYSYDRTASAMSANTFKAKVLADYKGDRHVHVSGGPLGRHNSLFINFINLPAGAGRAEAENNRQMFHVEGFDAKDPEAASPTGKVKIEMLMNALPSTYKLRTKTGTPEQICEYLVDFIEKVGKEVAPKV